MKHFAALLVFGFLFKNSPTVIILDRECDFTVHRSAPVVKIEPTGLVKFIYGPNSVEAFIVDKNVREVHVLDGGKYTFFTYTGQILHKTSAPICNPL